VGSRVDLREDVLGEGLPLDTIRSGNSTGHPLRELFQAREILFIVVPSPVRSGEKNSREARASRTDFGQPHAMGRDSPGQ